MNNSLVFEQRYEGEVWGRKDRGRDGRRRERENMRIRDE